jgi:hypothetical protein
MKAILGSNLRIKDKLLFSESLDNRKVLLNLITMLINFRTRRIGFNQLMSTYNPRFEAVGDDAIDYYGRKKSVQQVYADLCRS